MNLRWHRRRSCSQSRAAMSTRARIALGGVGTKPWRSPEAEAALTGKPANEANFRKAAEAALRDAKPQSENGSRSNWPSAA